jgi:hypothetical protein
MVVVVGWSLEVCPRRPHGTLKSCYDSRGSLQVYRSHLYALAAIGDAET